ncbi:MAG: hypothetical protein HY270_09085 [Deltaproteobacteria bacterium]|nr:hypothetical protein [Deltaproteobacteria bacterium]
MLTRVFTTCLLFVAIAPAAADDAPTATVAAAPAAVKLVASLDRKEAMIGDPLRYTVEISAPAGTELMVPVLSGGVGEFTITDFGDLPTRNDNGRLTVTRWYTLTCFNAGERKVPAPKVKYKAADGELKEVEGNEASVTIVSLLARDKSATDIRDIKPPEEVPFDWRPYGLGVAMLLVLIGIGAGFYFLLNRPKKAYVVPPMPAHEIALAALRKLHARRYIEEGRFEDFYVELSAIIRNYLEDGFHLRAPEMTTEEFLGAAGRDARLNANQRRLLSEFLSQADLVKFARHHPTLDDTEAAFAAAKRFVEETRPQHSTAAELTDAAA